MNYEIDKIENNLKNMFIIFNPKKLTNIKVIDDNDNIVYDENNLNELYKKLITSLYINE